MKASWPATRASPPPDLGPHSGMRSAYAVPLEWRTLTPVNDDAPAEQRPDAETEATKKTQALLRAARSSLGDVEYAAAGVIDDGPTRQLASEAVEAVERLTDHLVSREQDLSRVGSAYDGADPAPAGECRVEGCSASATQVAIRADGGEIAVCARCGEELEAVLPQGEGGGPAS